MGETFEILASERERLAAHGFASLTALLDGSPGREISVQPRADVRRLTLVKGIERGTYYLKRRYGESTWRMLGMLACGHRPQSGPLRELAMARRLKAAGFAAMEPVAWGERRVFGIPRAGFLLVREVPGQLVSRLYDESDENHRRALMRNIGELIGRLHRAGFLHPVRLKDLICTPGDGLVLIDRETSKPWTKKFTAGAGWRSLARAARRTLRDGHRIGIGTARAFLNGYGRGLGANVPLSCRPMARELMNALRSEFNRKRG